MDRRFIVRAAVPGIFLLTLLAGCGGSGGGDLQTAEDGATLSVPDDGTVTGQLAATGVQSLAVSAVPAAVELDDGERVRPVPVADDGSFSVGEVADGDQTLLLTGADGTVAELPLRMANRRGLGLGTVSVDGRGEVRFTGFNGYRFGWVDEDGDGVNDNFVDADGDGICDADARYAGYAYRTPGGFVDADGDGRNDWFRDADGDGSNDLDGHAYGHGFGWVDEDGDGVNDRFVDEDGDGICDLSGMPFSHPYGWADADGDGGNDHFTDADGDGINDLDGSAYVAMPGWVDEDGDGYNDRFADADGDGICDLSGQGYGHGFGWVDENGDGYHDHFADADGDGINDLAQGPYARFAYRYGASGPHRDGDGDGIDDGTGLPFRHGFGWVDEDGDGVNDNFVDADGDGVEDRFGCGYLSGFQPGMDPDGHMDGDRGGMMAF